MSAYDPLFDEDDLNHDSNYCQHGTFTGNPFGGDYMCHWCEMGEEPPTQFELDTWEVAKAEKSYKDFMHNLGDFIKDIPSRSGMSNSHRVRFWIVDWVAQPKAQRAWDRLNGLADTTRMSGY